MKRLSVLLLLYVLSASSVIAAMVELNDISFASSGASSIVNETTTTENNLTTLSKFPQATQSDAVPPTLWIVGLGLCLVLLGYKMKNKAE